MNPRPFAVFDIDGTLIRWQLYHAVADELVKSGVIDNSKYAPVREARMRWKNRRSQSSFSDYEHQLIAVIDEAILGISVEDVTRASRSVIERYKDQVYTYTRELIKSLRRQNYLLFALSASQSDIVKLLADYYRFDDYGASEYEVKDGRFTGQKTVLKREKKPLFLTQLVEKHRATWKGSLAIGDSESDIPLLSRVERPIAFNPTKDLFDRAEQSGWEVVIERKNMIYQLRPNRQGSFTLNREVAGSDRSV